MPRPSKGPRLYLRRGRIDPRTGKTLPARYFIRDGSSEIGTGCGPDGLREAEQALADHIANKWSPDTVDPDARSDPRQVLVADVLALYASERAPQLGDPESYAGWIKRLLSWWADRTLADVRRSTCDAYVRHRTSQTNSRAKSSDRKVSDQTARRELETLSAAIGYWHGEFNLTQRPIVKLPERAETPRDALTRSEAARLLKAALGYRLTSDGSWIRLGLSQRANRAHLRRAILVGLYTGSRPGVIWRLVWEESSTHPWVDLEAGVVYRRGRRVREQRTKRTPVVRLPPRLLAHLQRWRAHDLRREKKLQETDPDARITAVINHGGRALAGKIRTGFEGCVRDAGLNSAITPHWLRHTAATWLMENGAEIWAAAGFLGMTPATLEKRYGHHRPAYQASAVSAMTRRRD